MSRDRVSQKNNFQDSCLSLDSKIPLDAMISVPVVSDCPSETMNALVPEVGYCWGDGEPHGEAPQSTAPSLEQDPREATAPMWHHIWGRPESSGVLGQPGLGSAQGGGIRQRGGWSRNHGHVLQGQHGRPGGLHSSRHQKEMASTASDSSFVQWTSLTNSIIGKRFFLEPEDSIKVPLWLEMRKRPSWKG